MAFDGKKLLASTTGNDIYESLDGEEWKLFAENRGEPVRMAGGLIFALDATIYTSTDGKTWQFQNIDASSLDLRDVAHNGSLFVAVGRDRIADTAMLLTSPDAKAWKHQSFNRMRNDLHSICWTGTRFVVVGETISAFGDSTGKVTGNAGPILTSEDGITWTRRTTVSPMDADKVIWTGKRVVAVADEIMASPDGIDWKLQTWRNGYDIDMIANNGDQVVGFSYDTLYISDGSQGWIRRPNPMQAIIADALFTGKSWIAVTTGGKIYASPVDPTLAIQPRPRRQSQREIGPMGLFPYRGQARNALGAAH